MATKQQESQQVVQKNQEQREQNAVVGTRVLHTLGQPRDLHRVQVRRLWEQYFRVNIFVGGDAVSAKIAHSFFLAADSEGNITTCSPTLTRQY